MFCSRQLNKVHERGLRLIHRDEAKDFEQMLREEIEITIHQSILQGLLTKVCKIINGIVLPIMNSLFQFRCKKHSIRSFKKIFTDERKAIKYGMRTVRYHGPFTWAILHSKYKNTKSLDKFKSKIKAWKFDFCQCRLYKNKVLFKRINK